MQVEHQPPTQPLAQMQPIAKDRSVTHERVLSASLPVIAGILHPLPTTSLANASDDPISRTTTTTAESSTTGSFPSFTSLDGSTGRPTVPVAVDRALASPARDLHVMRASSPLKNSLLTDRAFG